jgi:hypothetical protein
MTWCQFARRMYVILIDVVVSILHPLTCSYAKARLREFITPFMPHHYIDPEVNQL